MKKIHGIGFLVIATIGLLLVGIAGVLDALDVLETQAILAELLGMGESDVFWILFDLVLIFIALVGLVLCLNKQVSLQELIAEYKKNNSHSAP